MNRFLCLDIETLSFKPNAVVLSCGVVYVENGIIMQEKEYYFDHEEQEIFGFAIDESIHNWWLQTDVALFNTTCEKGSDSDIMLETKTLAKMLSFYKEIPIFARGSHFDIPILEHLLNYFDITTPWKCYNIRDSRTLFDAARIVAPAFKEMEWNNELHGIKHVALNDARKEALDIVRAVALLQEYANVVTDLNYQHS